MINFICLIVSDATLCLVDHIGQQIGQLLYNHIQSLIKLASVDKAVVV